MPAQVFQIKDDWVEANFENEVVDCVLQSAYDRRSNPKVIDECVDVARFGVTIEGTDDRQITKVRYNPGTKDFDVLLDNGERETHNAEDLSAQLGDETLLLMVVQKGHLDNVSKTKYIPLPPGASVDQNHVDLKKVNGDRATPKTPFNQADGESTCLVIALCNALHGLGAHKEAGSYYNTCKFDATMRKMPRSKKGGFFRARSGDRQALAGNQKCLASSAAYC